MINRFLCFMWGHLWQEVIGYITVAQTTYGERAMNEVFEVTITKCKYCNGRKYD